MAAYLAPATLTLALRRMATASACCASSRSSPCLAHACAFFIMSLAVTKACSVSPTTTPHGTVAPTSQHCPAVDLLLTCRCTHIDNTRMTAIPVLHGARCARSKQQLRCAPAKAPQGRNRWLGAAARAAPASYAGRCRASSTAGRVAGAAHALLARTQRSTANKSFDSHPLLLIQAGCQPRQPAASAAHGGLPPSEQVRKAWALPIPERTVPYVRAINPQRTNALQHANRSESYLWRGQWGRRRQL